VRPSPAPSPAQKLHELNAFLSKMQIEGLVYSNLIFLLLLLVNFLNFFILKNYLFNHIILFLLSPHFRRREESHVVTSMKFREIGWIPVLNFNF
jgi:hypothetical protein